MSQTDATALTGTGTSRKVVFIQPRTVNSTTHLIEKSFGPMAVIFDAPYYHHVMTKGLEVTIQDGDQLIIPAPEPKPLKVDLTPKTSNISMAVDPLRGWIFNSVSTHTIAIEEPRESVFTFEEFIAGNHSETIDQFWTRHNLTSDVAGCEQVCIANCVS